MATTTEKDLSYMTQSVASLDFDSVAEVMADLLTDTDISTYDMYEDLISAYTSGNEDFRKGIDRALEILIWKDLDQLVKYMNDTAADRK